MSKPTYVVTKNKNGRVITRGDFVESFRGELWIFESVSRGVEYNGTAKVIVRPHDDTTDDAWNGWREFYAQVFDLSVATVKE